VERTGHRQQNGAVLLEALISILIFSVGILGLMGLQAASVRNSNDARLRADAVFLANQYLSEMAVDAAFTSSTVAATRTTDIATRYASPSGAAYTAWLTRLQAGGPNSVTLPRIADFPPLVTVAQGDTVRSLNIQITMRWALPGEIGNRRYVLSTTIGRNS
jgi:type IV pilus assembly protein PilV